MKILMTILVLCMAIALCGTAQGTDYIWDAGAHPDPSWHLAANWDLPGYPDDDEDTATIPWHPLGNYPEITVGNITIKALTLETNASGDGGADLWIGKELTIEGRDGLTVEEDATLRIGYNTRLYLNGGGTIVLDGRIEAVADLAYVFFAGPHTYVTTGDGIFLGTTPCTPLNLCQSGPSTLVLGPDNGIHGSAFVTIALVNKGLVDPNDPDGGIGDTITLTCEPKIGDGDWQVTCDACDEDSEKNTMIVKTVVVGTGDLVVGHHGLLQVKRMFSLHGDFTMSGEKAKIEVDKNVVFDVDRFTSQSCPQ